MRSENILRPVKLRERFRITAQDERRSRSQGVCRCRTERAPLNRCIARRSTKFPSEWFRESYREMSGRRVGAAVASGALRNRVKQIQDSPRAYATV